MDASRILLAAVTIFVLVPLTTGEEPVDGHGPSVWMRKKLDYSQAILTGLTSGDFDKIAENARAMHGLSKIEAFVRSRTPGYRSQLSTFLAANEELILQADEDNIEGATLAFTQVTISCVHCHKQLRQGEKSGEKKGTPKP
jgi:hypothetical protein